MKYDSVLDQQTISGKIVSLILCVWKPCYVKSGHKWFFEVFCIHALKIKYRQMLNTEHVYLKKVVNMNL